MNLLTKKMYDAIPVFGIIPMLYVLKQREQIEDYKTCSSIVDAINEYNTALTIFDPLPTHLRDINPKSYLQNAVVKYNLKTTADDLISHVNEDIYKIQSIINNTY